MATTDPATPETIEDAYQRGFRDGLRDGQSKGYGQGVMAARQALQELPIDPLYSQLIEELNLSVRAYNCLKRTGIHTVGDLAQMHRADLENMSGAGVKIVSEIVDRLRKIGIKLPGSSMPSPS